MLPYFCWLQVFYDCNSALFEEKATFFAVVRVEIGMDNKMQHCSIGRQYRFPLSIYEVCDHCKRPVFPCRLLKTNHNVVEEYSGLQMFKHIVSIFCLILTLLPTEKSISIRTNDLCVVRQVG